MDDSTRRSRARCAAARAARARTRGSTGDPAARSPLGRTACHASCGKRTVACRNRSAWCVGAPACDATAIDLSYVLDYYPPVGRAKSGQDRPPGRCSARDQVPDRGTTRDDPDAGRRIPSMSLEAAAIIFALLWGPTVLWLIFRAVRGPTGGTRESFAGEPAVQRTEQLPLEAGIRRDYWICKDCRSVNHLGAMHCYSCGIEREPVEPVAADPVRAGNGWVPVMDQSLVRPSGEPVPMTRLQPTSNTLPPDPAGGQSPARARKKARTQTAMVPAAAWRHRERRSVLVPPGVLARQQNLPPRRNCRTPFLPIPRWTVPSPSPRPSPRWCPRARGGTASDEASSYPQASSFASRPRHRDGTVGGCAYDRCSADGNRIPAVIAPAAIEPATNLPQVTRTIAPPVCPTSGSRTIRRRSAATRTIATYATRHRREAGRRSRTRCASSAACVAGGRCRSARTTRPVCA